MEIRLSLLIALLLAALGVVANALSLPTDDLKDNDLQLDGADKETDEGRRATWLETRDLEDDFKELVFLTIQELANEHRIDPRVISTSQTEAKEKRGRWQGFCFKRTRSGRFLPYICWKGDRK